jgi:hypothetical protein
MMRDSKDVRKGRFTLGKSVAGLPAGENADALVFVRVAGQVLTGSRKAYGWVMGGQVLDYAWFRVAVVDSRTGDVLFFAKPVMVKNLAKDPGSIKKSLRDSFRDFPKAKTAAAFAPKPAG